MTRLITDHRTVRRLDGDPLRQDLVSGSHTVSYLRHLVRGWLMQKNEVLAYCQAPPRDGGDGALIALLRSR